MIIAHRTPRTRRLHAVDFRLVGVLSYALGGASAGCSSDGLPRKALVPVDCSALPPASAEVEAAVEQGKVALEDRDIPSGSAQMVVTIVDSNGEQTYLPPGRDDVGIAFRSSGIDYAPTWTLSVSLDCEPEAAAFVHFQRDDQAQQPLASGDYPVVAVSFDVPEREQSSASDSRYFEGLVTITSVTNGLASGFMDGRGGGTLMSNYTQESVGVDYVVEAAAFREIPIW